MSPQVNFYLLKETNLDEYYRQTCLLVEKHFQPHKKTYIYTGAPSVSQQIDTLLWTFHDVSFLPHAIYKPGGTTSMPIVIIDDGTTNASGDILVNLAPIVPSCYNQFAQVLEVVLNEENYKKDAREKYKFYKGQNCNITTYNL